VVEEELGVIEVRWEYLDAIEICREDLDTVEVYSDAIEVCWEDLDVVEVFWEWWRPSCLDRVYRYYMLCYLSQ
jgi:hypothetical protein